MEMICPQCGRPVGEDNPLMQSEYEYMQPPREMCASCIQRWHGRITRAAKEELDEMMGVFRQAKNNIMLKYAKMVPVKGPLGGD